MIPVDWMVASDSGIQLFSLAIKERLIRQSKYAGKLNYFDGSTSA